MNLNKKFFVSTLAAAVLATGVFMTGQAEAGPHHYYRGDDRGQAYQPLTSERQQQYDTLMKDFADKTSGLRDKIAAKQIELNTLGSSPNPDPKVVGKVSEELVGLQNQFAQEQQALSDRISKDFGGDVYPGYGRGRGYRGMHRGYGDCPMPGGYGYGGGYGHRSNCYF